MALLTNSILKVVVYFNLFNYPLTIEEIKQFLDQPFNEDNFEEAFHKLLVNKKIFRLEKYYSVTKNFLPEYNRQKANTTAVVEIKKAKQIASFLYSFPFVKAIAISGSLSKNCADKNSDFDFFIITETGRLWIAKIILMLYGKIALTSAKRKQVCLNYFIDEKAMEIQEKNFYTAIEIITLLPCFGFDTIQHFFDSNNWVNQFFPNYQVKNTAKVQASPILKRMVEWLLSNRLADVLDNAIMLFFKKRWKKLFERNIYSDTGFRLGAYLVHRHYCKHMPGFLQQSILSRFEENYTKASLTATEVLEFVDHKSFQQ